MNNDFTYGEITLKIKSIKKDGTPEYIQIVENNKINPIQCKIDCFDKNKMRVLFESAVRNIPILD